MGDRSAGVLYEKQRSENEYNMGLLKNTVFIFRSLINYKPTAPDFFDFCLVPLQLLELSCKERSIKPY